MLYAGPTGVLTFLVTDYGKPWSNAGFGYKIRDWCDHQMGTHICAKPPCLNIAFRSALIVSLVRRLSELAAVFSYCDDYIKWGRIEVSWWVN